jgi:alpha-galactosidase
VQQDEQTLVLAKPMQDGSWAVGLFNLSETEREIAVDFTDLGRERPQRVRDLWRQVDLPPEASHYRARVAPHDVALVRLWSVED